MSEKKDFQSKPMPQFRGPGGGPPGGPGGPGMMGGGAKPKNTKGMIKRLWNYLSQNTFLLVLAFIFVIIYCVSTLAASYMIRPIINGILGKAGTAELVHNIVFMAIIYTVSAVCSYLQSRIMLEIAQKALERIRKDLFFALQKLPMKYFDNTDTGDIMSRFTNDVDVINQMLSDTCVQLISGVLTLVTTFAIMLYTNWRLALVTLVVAPLITLVTKAIVKRSRVYYKDQQHIIGELNSYMEESITGQKVIKVFNHEHESIEAFKKLNDDYKVKSFKAQFAGGVMGPVMGTLGQFSYTITACVGGLLCVFNGFDIGGYTIFLNYSKSFNRPISDISMQMNTIFAALAGAERVFEVIDEVPEADDDENTVDLKKIEGNVVLENVYFSYVKSVPILKNICLHARPGQKIAFVGSTGAGKTTITNLLNRFYDIDGGNIIIDGVNIKHIKKDFLRQNIAMVLQDTYLFTGTVADNIRYGRLDATDEEVTQAAKVANAHEFIMRLEHGYNTELTGVGANLSQGQRQLLNIARAVIAKAPILVLDEATGSVDTGTERHIEQALDRLMKTGTTFVIAHRLSTVRNADIIMVLEHGEIIEQGDHQTLLAQKGKYYSLYTGNANLE